MGDGQAPGAGSPEARRALLKELLRQRSAASARPALAPRSPGEPLVASPAQERFWILQALDPSGCAYNLCLTSRLHGALDVDALDQAVAGLVERHAVLRTAFEEGPEGPRPVLLLASAVRLERSAAPEGALAAAEAWAAAAVAEEARRPFDLRREPPFRARVLELGPEDFAVALSLHHIATDAWSNELLLADLGALYAAHRAGRPAPLPPLALTYADFAAWQRRCLATGAWEGQLTYWAKRLEGAPEELALPWDRSRPAVMTGAAGLVERALPAARTSLLRERAKAAGVSLVVWLEAAFAALLHRTSGASDLCIGNSVAGRTEPGTHALVGAFLNTVVLRLSLDERLPFLGLVERARDAMAEALAHQDVPFAHVVQRLKLARDLSRTPLFQVAFEHQAAGPASGAKREWLEGLVERESPGGAPGAKTDLELATFEDERDLKLALVFNADVLEPATAEWMLAGLARLLECTLDAPRTLLGALPLLGEAERRRVLEGWNATARAAPLERCAHELFEVQADRTPERVALRHGEETMRYAELDARANAWAHGWVQAGLSRDGTVALLADRGLALATAMLATLKAGAAYLPLDPRHPPARLAAVLRQARPARLEVARSHAALAEAAVALLPEPLRPPLGWLEALPQEGRRERLGNRARPGNLAYLIFTSGSTGEPKGALLEHRGMVNHLWAKLEALALTADDVVAQTASQCFDISVWQLFAPWMVGAEALIVPDAVVQEPEALRVLLDASGCTVAELVPSLLRALLEVCVQAPADALGRLRWMIPTGEALPAALCRDWFARFPKTPLLNAYGPTECSDDVTHHAMEAWDGSALTPIGRPVLNTQVYVLDERLEPRPPGCPGELYVGGAGVGRGYLGRPDLTAERFIPDPHGAPGGRLYRTGDRALYRPDGAIVFLGRADQQVKVRGFRIELEEIAAALERLPGVSRAAVLAPESAGGRQLLAYAVASGGTAGPDWPRRVLEALRAELPEYMVPPRLVALEAMPLTPNGKVDLRALEARGDLAPERPLTAPRNPGEVLLSRLWRETLGVTEVSVEDRFFEVGGHSLLAIQLASRIRTVMGVPFSVEDLFTLQSIARMERVLSERLRLRHRPVDAGDGPGARLLPLRPEGEERPLFCIAPAMGSSLVFFQLPRTLPQELPVIGVQAPELAAGPSPATLEARAALFVSLLTAESEGPYRLLGYSSGGVIAVEMARQLEAAGHAVELVAVLDADAPLLAGTAVGEDPGLPEGDAALYRRMMEQAPREMREAFDALGTDAERTAFLREDLEKSGIVPPGVSDEDLKGPLRAAVATQYALERYRPLPYPGRVELFCTEANAADASWLQGWKALVPDGLTVRPLAGNHEELLSYPSVEALGAHLVQLLTR